MAERLSDESVEPAARCFLQGCCNAASSRCGKCKVARYCCSGHQLAHWKAGHKAECSPSSEAVALTRPVVRAAVPPATVTLPIPTESAEAPPSSTPSPKAPSKKAAPRGKAGGAAASFDPEPRGSYPSEPLIDVHGDPALDLFREPTRQDRKLLQSSTPLVLHFGRGFEAQLSLAKRCVVDARTFATQFRDFTCGVFEGMPADLWANVAVAGGAALAALLPLDRCWKAMPVARRPGGSFSPLHDFSLVMQAAGYEATADDSLTRTPSQFMRSVRWPGSDIDIFFYGIADPATADAKARALLEHFKRVMEVPTPGVTRGTNPVAFIRTQNTITIDGGRAFRKVQIITRLYKTQADVLNSFDIDCCCVGFDGSAVRMTPRAQRAITHKANIVNLDIRGYSFEYRLCKYAERGFAIGVPALKRGRISPQFVDCGVSNTHGFKTVGDDFWRRWNASSGKLTRILLIEAAAKRFGHAPDPFRGRFKKDDPNTDKVINIKLILPGRELDTYPPSSRESHHLNKEWLAVPDSDALDWGSSAGGSAAPRPAKPIPAVQRRGGQLAVQWEHGSMSRTPLSWEEWGAPAYAAIAPVPDYAARVAARELKLKEEAAARIAEVAARAAELAALRRSRDDATQQASESNAAATAAKAAAKAQLVQLQAVYDARIAAIEAEAIRTAAIAQASAAAAAADSGAGGSASGGGSGDADASLCIVCLDSPRRVALQPCGHYSFCKCCAGEVMRLGQGRCPVCRSLVKVAQEIFV